MSRPRCILFDVNGTLLDLQPIKAAVGRVLGGGEESARLWFVSVLQYSQTLTLTGHYANFDDIGAAFLRMLADTQGFEITETRAREVIAQMRSLSAYPDVRPALEALLASGYRLAALTNSSRATLAAQMQHSGLQDLFKFILSVEEIRTYKPHPDVYRWAARQVGAAEPECLMVAAHAWDITGAISVGMKSAFVARPGQSFFPLGPQSPIVVQSLGELPELINSQ